MPLLGHVTPVEGVRLTLAEAKAVMKMETLAKLTTLFDRAEAEAWASMVAAAKARIADYEKWAATMAAERRGK